MSRKTRVAFFAEILIPDYDGASRTMFEIIKRIPQETFEFLFICGTGPDSDIGFEVIEIPSIKIPYNETYKMSIPFLSARVLKRKLNDFKPDVIHLASPSPLGDFAHSYAKRNSIQVISIYHTHFISYVDYYLKKIPFFIPGVKFLVSRGQRIFYNKCDLIYVPTQVMIDELSTYRFNTQRMKIWQRGINGQLFNPQKRDQVYMQELMGNDRPNLLFASRLVWEKNLQLLINIYKLSESKSKAFNFIIAGDGVARQSLEKAMPNAMFMGKCTHENLAVLYASADVFVFPSISETYGNVIAEAMSSGLPCVIANGGGTLSFIDHGVNGFICASDDPNDFLDKIEEILSNQTLHQSFKMKSIARSNRHTWESLTKIYFDDLKSLSRQTNQSK